MKVAAAVESSPGGSGAAGATYAPRLSAGAGHLGATTTGVVSSPATSEESFRSGWHAILASIGAGEAIPDETEGTSQVGRAALESREGDALQFSAALTGSQQPGHAARPGGGLSGVAEERTTRSFKTPTSTRRLTFPEGMQSSERTNASRPSEDSSAAADRSTRITDSDRRKLLDAVQTGGTSGTIPGPGDTLAPVLPCVPTGSSRAAFRSATAAEGNAEAGHFASSGARSTGVSVGNGGMETGTDLSGAQGAVAPETANRPATSGGSASRTKAGSVSRLGGETDSQTTSERTGATEDEFAQPVGRGACQPAPPSDVLAESPGTRLEQGPTTGNQASSTGLEGLSSLQADSLQSQAARGTAPGISSAATLPTAGKRATAGKDRGAESETGRPVREAGSLNPARRGSDAHGQQPSASSVDAATTVRDPASPHVVAKTADDAESASNRTTSGAGIEETFAALDAESTSGRPAWIHAGAQRAEAGIEDPVLGWVGIRADFSGGGVHASLVPGSADAAQALGGHLAGLNAYLSDHHTPVESLTLAAPENGWSEPGAGTGQGMGQGDQRGQGAGQGGEATAPASFNRSLGGGAAATSQMPLQGFEETEGNARAIRSGGIHISVLA